MRSGELFAGYGGLALAVEEVFGARTAWVADVCGEPDKGRPHKSPHGAPCTILAERFPGVPNLGDVTAVDWAQVEPVDILGGGFPCQDVSHAGKRAGLRDGTRTGLWSRMAEAIDTLRPRLVVAENVRGLLSAPADSDVEPCSWCLGESGDGEPALRALGAVLADLADLGYDAAWTGLRAADVGAPHGRFRVFVLAWPADAARDTRWLDDGDAGAPLRGGVAAGVTLLRTPTAQLAVNGGSQHPAKRKAGGHGPTLADEVEHLLPTPAVNDMGAGKSPDAWDAWTERMKAAHGNGNGHGKSLAIEALRLLPPSAEFGQYAPAIARWEAVSGRHAPAPTEPTGRGGAARLSPLFVEWMMGLPAGWVTDVPAITRTEALRALGNGVVPQQAAAALRYLLTVRAQALATPAVKAMGPATTAIEEDS